MLNTDVCVFITTNSDISFTLARRFDLQPFSAGSHYAIFPRRKIAPKLRGKIDPKLNGKIAPKLHRKISPELRGKIVSKSHDFSAGSHFATLLQNFSAPGFNALATSFLSQSAPSSFTSTIKDTISSVWPSKNHSDTCHGIKFHQMHTHTFFTHAQHI